MCQSDHKHEHKLNGVSMSKFSVAAFVSQTVNGYQQTGYALLSNGFWVTRSSGSHIWAMSEGKARELAVKAGGSVATTPEAFVRWGALVKAVPLATQHAAPVVAAMVQAASAAAAAPKKPRSVAQCAATLRLVSTNALRCERKEIGGDLGKARKAVGTAFDNYGIACKAAGVEMDAELVENAKFAAGFDEPFDAQALGK